MAWLTAWDPLKEYGFWSEDLFVRHWGRFQSSGVSAQAQKKKKPSTNFYLKKEPFLFRKDRRIESNEKTPKNKELFMDGRVVLSTLSTIL